MDPAQIAVAVQHCPIPLDSALQRRKANQPQSWNISTPDDKEEEKDKKVYDKNKDEPKIEDVGKDSDVVRGQTKKEKYKAKLYGGWGIDKKTKPIWTTNADDILTKD